MANIGPLVLCTRVTNAITYTDPNTKRTTTTEVRGFPWHERVDMSFPVSSLCVTGAL